MEILRIAVVTGCLLGLLLVARVCLALIAELIRGEADQ